MDTSRFFHLCLIFLIFSVTLVLGNGCHQCQDGFQLDQAYVTWHHFRSFSCKPEFTRPKSFLANFGGSPKSSHRWYHRISRSFTSIGTAYGLAQACGGRHGLAVFPAVGGVGGVSHVELFPGALVHPKSNTIWKLCVVLWNHFCHAPLLAIAWCQVPHSSTSSV